MNPAEIESIVRKVASSPNNRCFACGPGNPVGLRLRFRLEDGTVRAEFVPGRWHEGWQGVVHGGILGTVLDEAMAYCLFYAGAQGVTARMEVRYRNPASWGDALSVEASIARDTRRLADIRARLRRGDTIIAEAEARYVKMGNLVPESLLTEPDEDDGTPR